jgi:SET domain-containing protein
VNHVVNRESPIHGKGLFAAVDFKAGDRILLRDDSRLVTEDNPLREGEDVYHCDWIADGRVVYAQEPERYTNHSCDPNAVVDVADGVRYCTARRDIRAGEEITYDYCIDADGDTVWECNCGSPRCRKTIHASFFALPQEVQIEYVPYLSHWFKERFTERIEALVREAEA